MKRKQKIIKKPNFLDIMEYKKEIYGEKSLQYCITTFITGLIFLFISIPINTEPMSSIIETLSCSMFVISIYYIPLPFFSFEKTNEMLKKLFKYLILLITTLSHSIVWHTYCNINLNVPAYPFILLLMSTLQIILIILCVFFAIAPTLNAIKIIIAMIKENIDTNSEKNNPTKSLLTSASAILPFITAIITFINTIFKT